MTALPFSSFPQDYQDILQILPHLPGPEVQGLAAAPAAVKDLRPEQWRQRLWLASWQGRAAPRLAHGRVAVFAANQGAARLLPPAIPAVTVMAALHDPDGELGRAVGQVDADLRLYDMNLATASGDLTAGAALDTPRCLRALVYGMMAAEPGIDALALGACGDGQALGAAALIAALFGQTLDSVMAAMGLPAALQTPLAAALAAAPAEPCAVLERYGDEAIAAMAGVMLAARMARMPVVVDSWAGLAALGVVEKLKPGAGRHVALTGAAAACGWLPEQMKIAAVAGAAPGLAAARALKVLQDAAR